jgi:hypothetical protein
MMRLRLRLFVHDLACHFQISDSLVSSILITWIKLMRLELSHLIVWLAKHVIKESLPLCFKKFYPHVRCIIDCTEVFIETPVKPWHSGSMLVRQWTPLHSEIPSCNTLFHKIHKPPTYSNFPKRKKMCMVLYKFVVICSFLLMVQKRSFCSMKQLYCIAFVYLYSRMHKLIFKMVIKWA